MKRKRYALKNMVFQYDTVPVFQTRFFLPATFRVVYIQNRFWGCYEFTFFPRNNIWAVPFLKKEWVCSKTMCNRAQFWRPKHIGNQHFKCAYLTHFFDENGFKKKCFVKQKVCLATEKLSFSVVRKPPLCGCCVLRTIWFELQGGRRKKIERVIKQTHSTWIKT